jgi:hypothetical protein
MIDKRLRNQITQLKLIISVAELLNFDSSITRFIKYGSKYACAALGDLISC